MGWILDNLQFVIVIASTIAWWLTQRNQGDEEDGPKPGERPGREKIDVDQLERNRRLREEIRRKREQRQRGGDQPAPTMQERGTLAPNRRPELDVPEDVREQIPPVLRELMGIPEPQPRAPEPAPPPLPEVNPVTQRQERMEREMAELAAKQREAEALAARVAVPGTTSRRRRRRSASSSSLSDRDFLATLRDPAQARRAIVLREILGKPLALR
jgi:hypothetical protein